MARDKTVLLVDDHLAIRSALRATLEGIGYEVLEAVDGEDALKVGNRFDGRIDLLVTDVVMPGLGGFELAEALALSRPETKVIYTSGHLGSVPETVVASIGVYLAKPFTAPDLMRVLAQLA